MIVSMKPTTQYNNLSYDLQSTGFSENQAKVYLACLELGPSSIWDISKKSGIKRPTCYDILEELAFKGYASYVNSEKRVIYSVISPKQLMQTEERRHNRVLLLANQLEALSSKSHQKPKIMQFEGEKGVEEAFNLLFLQPKGTELLIYGSLTLDTKFSDFLDDYTEKRLKRNISARMLYSDTTDHREILNKNLEKYLFNVKFLPKEKFMVDTHEVYIFGDTIAYIAHSEKEPFATVIENAPIVSSEKQRFEILWEIAKN